MLRCHDHTAKRSTDEGQVIVLVPGVWGGAGWLECTLCAQAGAGGDSVMGRNQEGFPEARSNADATCALCRVVGRLSLIAPGFGPMMACMNAMIHYSKSITASPWIEACRPTHTRRRCQVFTHCTGICDAGRFQRDHARTRNPPCHTDTPAGRLDCDDRWGGLFGGWAGGCGVGRRRCVARYRTGGRRALRSETCAGLCIVWCGRGVVGGEVGWVSMVRCSVIG